MDVTFGDKNQFEEGTVFGRGVKLGDNNKVYLWRWSWFLVLVRSGLSAWARRAAVRAHTQT